VPGIDFARSIGIVGRAFLGEGQGLIPSPRVAIVHDAQYVLAGSDVLSMSRSQAQQDQQGQAQLSSVHQDSSQDRVNANAT
jgi:hypothetical protein